MTCVRSGPTHMPCHMTCSAVPQAKFGSEQRSIVLPSTMQRAGTMAFAMVRDGAVATRLEKSCWVPTSCAIVVSALLLHRAALGLGICDTRRPMSCGTPFSLSTKLPCACKVRVLWRLLRAIQIVTERFALSALLHAMLTVLALEL
jgi:hypothetical protein